MWGSRRCAEVLDGGISPLTRAMNLQKRVRKFDRKDVGATEERSSHHSEDDSVGGPPGLTTSLKPITAVPERRRSDGDVRLSTERLGAVDYLSTAKICPESSKKIQVPPKLVKASIKPMGVPLATAQVSGEIQVAAENELFIHRLEELGERKDPERVWTKVNKYTTYALRGFGNFNVSLGRGLFGVEL